VNRLDEQRQLELLGGGKQILFRTDYPVIRRRNVQRAPDQLCHVLIHGQRRAEHAATGIRQSDGLQRALNGAVLTAAAVQDEKRPLELRLGQNVDDVATLVHAVGVHAVVVESLEHGTAAQQRDLALGRISAVNNGDLAEVRGSGGVAMLCAHLDLPPRKLSGASCSGRPTMCTSR
jgi:hypothetical protein